MHVSALIVLVLAIALLLGMGFIGGTMGWKLSGLMHDLKMLPTAPLGSYTFRNGDLVLFSSSRPIDALHVMMADCPITHVGMVVENPHNGLLRCWELAFESTIPDIISLTSLHARLRTYQGTVAVRGLRRVDGGGEAPLSRQDTYDVVRKIQHENRMRAMTYRASFYLNTYDSRTSGLFFWHPPLPIEATDAGDREWICTDLVSETYRRLGVFHSRDRSLWPRDFYSKRENLPIASDKWEFSDEVRLIP